MPKKLGGVGIRSMKDLNLVLLSKLGWTFHTSSHKIWVRLIRSCYLQGGCTLELKHTKKATSWIWDSLKHSHNLLMQGFYYQIGKHSTLNIGKDPWIPRQESFKIPNDIHLSDDIFFVRHLMQGNSVNWDKQKVEACFPSDLA